MINKTDAIKNFLNKKAHFDLATLYNHDMEVQVNVARDGGERVDGEFKGKQWNGFSDGMQIWKPIRIPYTANTNPIYNDSPITFDLETHAEGIGCTGWNWKSKCSKWVGFDFDALVGHSDRHAKKLTDIELNHLKEAVSNVPWITLRHSTGGRGLHLYIFVDDIQTQTHTEHAALARSILHMMCGQIGFDFKARVDVCGYILWFWHRKIANSFNKQGLKLIKQGITLPKNLIPTNWKDHIPVTGGKRNRNLPFFIEKQKEQVPNAEDIFTQLTGKKIRVPLDNLHIKLRDWIQQNYQGCSWWDNDHWMLVTHTSILKEAHSALNLKGPFETVASGAHKGNDWNCFCIPLSNGAWLIRRYSIGCEEHPIWITEPNKFTFCYYNRNTDLKTAAHALNGLEDKSSGYWFESGEIAKNAAAMLNCELQFPNWIGTRKTMLKQQKDGRLLVEFPILGGDESRPSEGWLLSKSKWSRLFNVELSNNELQESILMDDEIRHLITSTGEDYGWVINSDGSWHSESLQHVKSYLRSKINSIEKVVGCAVGSPWTVVNLPFEDEYPRDRLWNRFSTQLRFRPTENRDALSYPNWLKILNHLGANLTDTIENNEWCKENNILTGADYLKVWIANLFQNPLEPLPYLFFYGPQNSGKSIFHEAISLLVTNGICRADLALTNSAGFNGELENALLCVVEETDLKKNTQAYNRIKDWVTSIRLPIRKMYCQPYTILNMSKWIQCSNNQNAVPILPGDSRIVMIYVDVLAVGTHIPKRDLIPSLEKEASDFLAEILNLDLPLSNDRLAMPVLQTEDKLMTEISNQSFLELFLYERCYYNEGEMVSFADFYDKFIEYIDPTFVKDWSKIRVGKELPMNKFPKGRISTGHFFVGNISFTAPDPNIPHKSKLILKDGKLIHYSTIEKS